MKLNQKSNFAVAGMSKTTNAKAKDRAEFDYYATDPVAIDCLIPEVELNQKIWECACGEGHLSERLADYGYEVYSTDLIDRGYGDDFFDFLKCSHKFEGDIITNPPFKYFEQFMTKGLECINEGNKLILLGKIQILEGQKRGKFFIQNPPRMVLVFSKRLQCARNGDFVNFSDGMQAYAWFVFEKGYKGKTELRWVNNEAR